MTTKRKEQNTTDTTGQVENAPDLLVGATTFIDQAPEAEPMPEPIEAFVDDQGRRHQTFISAKDFIPAGNKDNLLRFLLDLPVGYVEWLGSISGWANKSEDKTNRVKDGAGEKDIKSICLIGEFEAVIPDRDGVLETRRSTALYLPNAYAQSVKNALGVEGTTSVDLDVEIGVAKTGRSIPYEWAVRSYGNDATEQRLRAIKARQRMRLERRGQKLALGSAYGKTIEHANEPRITDDMRREGR